MLSLLRLFDSNEKDIKRYQRVVDQINALEPSIASLDTESLQAKTDEFRRRVADGESLDSLLPEAFAVVRETSKRILKMRHYDVQLIGGMVLHDGRISEMKTGEGKTLMASLALYLNALEGRGAHLVTANDYLSRRDAVWMAPLYHSLGMSVGVIQGQSAETGDSGGSFVYDPNFINSDERYMYLRDAHRSESYACDIVYGTNNEFGFDYLRDNMSFSKEELVQRDLHYAIVDEVDSILVDEARTPLIISGYAGEPTDLYDRVDKVVRLLEPETHFKLEEKQKIVTLTEEGITFCEQGLGVDNLSENQAMMTHVSAALKAHAIFKLDIDYVVKQGKEGPEIIIVDEFTGRLMFGRRYSDGLHQAIESKEGVKVRQENQTLATITFQNYFRIYDKLAGMTGTAKTEEDEFRKIYALDVVQVPTNKPLIRKDQPDVIYKSEEAKIRGIATDILRLYCKQQPVLVGTRSIEMSEKLSARLQTTALKVLCLIHLIRHKLDESKQMSNEEKTAARAILNTPIRDLNISKLTPLATKFSIVPDMEMPENLAAVIKLIDAPAGSEGLLKGAFRGGVPHNVLNAKYHEKEAIIIADAGKVGAVTIATNMAGRGVDILLGGTMVPEVEDSDELEEGAQSYRRGHMTLLPPPANENERSVLADQVRAVGGLFVLGTERHESRRIDNQLRGRSGRQGDPGESRFFVSLEDELWRRFGDRSNHPFMKLWEEDQSVDMKMLSRMIEKAQKKVEAFNFEIRKNVLDYDEVMNEQRNTIYGDRRRVLEGAELTSTMQGFAQSVSAGCVALFHDIDNPGQTDVDAAYRQLDEIFDFGNYVTLDELKAVPEKELEEYVQQKVIEIYEKREEELTSDLMRAAERWCMLHAINNKWMEHLANMDFLHEHIGLRGYGQKDPLVEYKKEAFEMFQAMMGSLQEEAVRWIYHINVAPAEPEEEAPRVTRLFGAGESEEDDAPTSSVRKPQQNSQPQEGGGGDALSQMAQGTYRSENKVGRNDPCPCGSGKKFKKCHGKDA
ncbi:MAG: preprotein translocase subunit SecA [Armatimonadota bacterium]